jgi:hypothetical protein
VEFGYHVYLRGSFLLTTNIPFLRRKS